MINNIWNKSQECDDYIDFEKELIGFDDNGKSSVDMRLVFVKQSRTAYIVLLRKNNDGETRELIDQINITWEEGERFLGKPAVGRIKEKWKRFAIGQVLSGHSPNIDPVALYDLIEQAADDELQGVFDDWDVLVWQPFENFKILDVVSQITELATRAQDIEKERNQ